jgi:hypothetical protein
MNMGNEYGEKHELDADGNPAGGITKRYGLTVYWQDGPVDPEAGPNGAQVDDVLAAALGRLQFLNSASDGRFACRENALAITKVQEAIFWQQERTRSRIARGVEATHTP